MTRLLALLLAALFAAAPLAVAEDRPPLDPPLNHFSILIGVTRLQEDPRRASPPAQARDLLQRIGWLQRNSASLLRLDDALNEALDESQRRFLLEHLDQPDPLDFFGSLETALAALPEGRPGPPAAPARNEGVDCVLVAWGVPRMDLRSEQGPRLRALLGRVQVLAWEDEQSMRYLYHRLDPDQKRVVRRMAPVWAGGRSPRELEEVFERLLTEAAASLRARLLLSGGRA